MESFTIKEKYLEQKDKDLLAKIEYIFDELPERTFKTKTGTIDITCHHLAHALAKCFPNFKAVDGRFSVKGRQHSWLEEDIKEKEKYTIRNTQGHTIIDPYPIAGIKPQMYYGFNGGPWNKLYIPATLEERKLLHEGLLLSPKFEKHVQLIQSDIEKILKKKFSL